MNVYRVNLVFPVNLHLLVERPFVFPSVEVDVFLSVWDSDKGTVQLCGFIQSRKPVQIESVTLEQLR